MHIFFHKVEHAVDKLIPYAVVLLLWVIVVTFFFHEWGEAHHAFIVFADVFIIGIFVLDLVFKFIRVRKIKKFVRLYWLDIIAVFPFYLVMRAVEEIVLLTRLSELTKEPQAVLHAGKEINALQRVEREAVLLVDDVEKLGRASRSRFAVRFLRPIARVPRLLKFLPYYERTTGEHHPHDKKKHLGFGKKAKQRNK